MVCVSYAIFVLVYVVSTVTQNCNMLKRRFSVAEIMAVSHVAMSLFVYRYR